MFILPIAFRHEIRHLLGKILVNREEGEGENEDELGNRDEDEEEEDVESFGGSGSGSGDSDLSQGTKEKKEKGNNNDDDDDVDRKRMRTRRNSQGCLLRRLWQAYLGINLTPSDGPRGRRRGTVGAGSSPAGNEYGV